MRVFFDASVIIAALLSSTGASSLLIKYVKAGRFTGVTSQTALNEVLHKTDKIRKTKIEIKNFIAESGLLVIEEIDEDEIEHYKNRIDIEDAHLIAGANLSKCGYLVSLDKKHLLKDGIKKEFLPLKIVSTKELIEEIVSK